MQSTYYSFQEIRPNVYRISCPECVFMELFVGREKALLFDTGHSFDNLKEAIRSKTDLPLIIVNSHGHPDHSGGNFWFSEDIFIHENDMELCRGANSVKFRTLCAKNAQNFRDYATGEIRNILPKDFDENYYIKQNAGNLLPVKEGDIFDLGGITLKVFELPGHTRGCISLLYQEEKILYSNDAINDHLWLFLDESTKISTYINTLYKAKNIDFNIFYRGHNAAPCDKAILDDYLDCAENLDFEAGYPYDMPLHTVDNTVRMCIRRGYEPKDADKPGYCVIVISENHL